MKAFCITYEKKNIDNHYESKPFLRHIWYYYRDAEPHYLAGNYRMSLFEDFYLRFLPLRNEVFLAGILSSQL